jgi:hypothetical protein
MKVSTVLTVGLVLCVPLMFAQERGSNGRPPYLMLQSRETKRLQKQLTDASLSGYRVNCLVNSAWPENSLFLERQSEAAEPVEYLLVGVERVPTWQKELNQAAGRGFRVLRTAVGVTREGVAVMEKRSSTPRRYEYLVVDTRRPKTFEKEIHKLLAQGWELLWCKPDALPQLAILERPLDRPPESPGSSVERDAGKGVMLVCEEWPSLDLVLSERVSNGYRVFWVPRQVDGPYQCVVLAKADPAPSPEYRVIGTEGVAWADELQQRLQSAAGEGFRLLWPTQLASWGGTHLRNVTMIMEKTPSSTSRCQYEVRAHQPADYAELLAAAAQGWRIFDVLDWFLVLEKCSQ